MRLLNISTLEFRDFPADNTPPYLVTSHRWSADEATYKDVLKKRNQGSTGFKKILGLCSFARQHQGTDVDLNRWIWIDTCCINQNSSAEISESINSMWEWYAQSNHCIAYLHDVRPLSAGGDAVLFDFRRSAWFERGWTLQELLAPPCVVFLTRDYEIIGRKSPSDHACPVAGYSLNKIISEVTGISQELLCDFVNRRHVIGRETKMAWAANRQTTKPEDLAYCLLGMFDVHMPLIYGEGERNARKRLEQEITKRELEEDDFLDPMSKLYSTRPVEWRHQGYSNAQEFNATDHYASSLYATDQTVDSEYICPICKLLLLDPVTTSCGHTMCDSCLLEDNRINMTIVPIDSEGEPEGDAATENFQGIQYCPSCRKVGDQASSAPFVSPNYSLTQGLRSKYPRQYAQRTADLHAASENVQNLIINIGNWHELVDTHHHRWTFFVKPSRTDIIKEIHLYLHESFKNPHIIRTKPPYSFHGKGWGYFNIDTRVVLKPGYAWISSEAEDGPDGAVSASLRLNWMLDFASFEGRGAMGRCRVKFRRGNPSFRSKLTAPLNRQ